jgi:hypothetical protein
MYDHFTKTGSGQTQGKHSKSVFWQLHIILTALDSAVSINDNEHVWRVMTAQKAAAEGGRPISAGSQSSLTWSEFLTGVAHCRLDKHASKTINVLTLQGSETDKWRLISLLIDTQISVRKRFVFAPFCTKNRMLSKTGLGQTYRKS